MTSVQLINIFDRNYTEWNIKYIEGEADHTFCPDPALNKLFDGDNMDLKTHEFHYLEQDWVGQ